MTCQLYAESGQIPPTSKPPLVMPRMIRGGGICEANDGGDLSLVSECSEICYVRIASVSFADSSPCAQWGAFGMRISARKNALSTMTQGEEILRGTTWIPACAGTRASVTGGPGGTYCAFSPAARRRRESRLCGSLHQPLPLCGAARDSFLFFACIGMERRGFIRLQ